MHDLVEVGPYLARACQLEQSSISTGLIDGAGAELSRVDPIERRRLMQPDKRIRRRPMAARLVIAIDNHDGGVGFGDERVGERHPHCSRTNDKIVSLEGRGHVSASLLERADATSSVGGANDPVPVDASSNRLECAIFASGPGTGSTTKREQSPRGTGYHHIGHGGRH